MLSLSGLFNKNPAAITNDGITLINDRDRISIRASAEVP